MGGVVAGVSLIYNIQIVRDAPPSRVTNLIIEYQLGDVTRFVVQKGGNLGT